MSNKFREIYTKSYTQHLIGVNLLHVSINKIYGYIEGSNGHKCLMLVSTDKNKDMLKRNEELWNKIRDLIRSKTNNVDNCDKKDMKIKLTSDYD